MKTESKKMKTNPEHKHAVVHFEHNFGRKITRVLETHDNEHAARQRAEAMTRRGDKGTPMHHTLCGTAYARLTDAGWMLDEQGGPDNP